MKDKARKPTTTPSSEPPPAEGPELPERWSVQRKTELVLQLLRGEALDAVAPIRVTCVALQSSRAQCHDTPIGDRRVAVML